MKISTLPVYYSKQFCIKIYAVTTVLSKKNLLKRRKMKLDEVLDDIFGNFFKVKYQLAYG